MISGEFKRQTGKYSVLEEPLLFCTQLAEPVEDSSPSLTQANWTSDLQGWGTAPPHTLWLKLWCLINWLI